MLRKSIRTTSISNVILIISLLMIMSLMGFSVFNPDIVKNDIKAAEILIPEPKILIDGDAELIAYPDKTGTGILGDPYIISHKAIRCGGDGSGIEIRNTTKFLRLEFLNLTTPYLLVNNSYVAGLMLINCSNIVVQNCNIVNNIWGVLIQDCTDCVVTENEIWDTNIGVYVQENTLTSNIIICENVIKDQGCGIFFERCRNSIITGNSLSNHSWFSIELEETRNVSICSNTIDSKPNVIGIQLWGSNDTLISENYIEGSKTSRGVQLSFSHSTKFEKNTLYDNSIGIGLYKSDNNELIENNITLGDFGIYLKESNYNLIEKNRFSDISEKKIEEIDCVENKIIPYINWGVIIISSSAGLVTVVVTTISVILVKKKRLGT